jgi:hypothetical protein
MKFLKILLGLILLALIVFYFSLFRSRFETRIYPYPGSNRPVVIQSEQLEEVNRRNAEQCKKGLSEYGISFPNESKVAADWYTSSLFITHEPAILNQIEQILTTFGCPPDQVLIGLKTVVVSNDTYKSFLNQLRVEGSTVILDEASTEILSRAAQHTQEGQVFGMNGETFTFNLSDSSFDKKHVANNTKFNFEGKPLITEDQIAISYSIEINFIEDSKIKMQQTSSLSLPVGKSAILRTVELDKTQTFVILLNSTKQKRFTSYTYREPNYFENLTYSIKRYIRRFHS